MLNRNTFINIEEILNKINKNKLYIDILASDHIYNIISLTKGNINEQKIISNNIDSFFNKIRIDFGLIDCLSLLRLIELNINKEKCMELFDLTMKEVFNIKTIMFLRKINKYTYDNSFYKSDEIFDLMISELIKLENEKISTILFDLILTFDFKYYLKKEYPIVEKLLSLYQKNSIEENTNTLYNGSNILGCLLKKDNQLLAYEYIKLLLDKYKLKLDNIEYIGGGGSNLVYKIGDSVIKLGETRSDRKIYVNHRILASQVRKLLKSKNGKDLFYVEIMRYIQTDGITKKDLIELKEDLLRQGLIWDDAKLANCGILPEGYDNKSTLDVDYIDVAGIVDNPLDREEFMKRKRKVVVLDNDNIRKDPRSNWK